MSVFLLQKKFPILYYMRFYFTSFGSITKFCIYFCNFLLKIQFCIGVDIEISFYIIKTKVLCMRMCSQFLNLYCIVATYYNKSFFYKCKY